MKKLLGFILATLMLTACSAQGDDAPSASSRKDPEDITYSSPESSIFGRKVSYEAYTPAEGIALPVPSEEITDIVQIEKRLFILGNGAVYQLDIESGESRMLFEGSDILLAAYGSELFSYSKGSYTLTSYDENGSIADSRTLSTEDYIEIRGLIITENYVVLHCTAQGNNMPFNQYRVFDKETLEPVKNIDEKQDAGGALRDTMPRAYKANLLLVTRPDSYSDSLMLYSLDIDTGRFSKLIKLSQTKSYDSIDYVYNSKTDTAIVYTAPSGALTNQEESASPYYISEYSLSDPDNVVLQKHYLENHSEASLFVTVYENIISTVSGTENSYRYYDFLNPPKSITVVGNQTLYGDAITSFEMETGVLVRTVDYDSDYERLDIKLMAKDKDFDLFSPVSYNVYKYVRTNTYSSLNSYSGLLDRLSQSPLAQVLAANGDEYFGLPLYGTYSYPKESYPDKIINADGSETDNPVPFAVVATQGQYCARNIDALAGTYNDPDGDELYEVLMHLDKKPSGDNLLFGDEFIVNGEFCSLSCEYLMMNPASENKEDAAKFLEYVFDANSINYPPLEEGESYLAFWRIMPSDYMTPLYSAFNRASQGGLSQSELKALAKEAAKEVLMRMEG